ncbi:MAG: DUF2079 domain-containing protein [Chthoniobacteraceae bacterium]
MFRRVTAFPRPILWAAIIFFIAIVAMSGWHWWTFRYTTFDLAFYVQALSEALVGRWNVSLLDVPLLGNHAEPIVFLALPLYAAWPHPMLLVVLQTLAVATMPFTAWKICRALDLGEKESFALALATIIAPATGWMALHEFHPETLAAPLILALANARLRQKCAWFWVWWILLVGCKENIALTMVAWSAVLAVIEFRQGWRHLFVWNVAPGLVAGAWMVAYGGWISPMLNGGKVDYLELYSHLGRTAPEIVTGFVTEPSRAFHALQRSLSEGNLLPGVYLPWLGLMLLRPRWLLIGAPILFQHLLSWRPSEWEIYCHYAAPLVALAWLGMAEAVARFRHPLHWSRAVLAGSVIAQIVLGPSTEIFQELGAARGHLAERRWKAELLQPIQSRRDASVMASMGFLSHLADRERLHSLHHLLKGLKTLSRARYHPPKVDVMAIDFGDESTFSRASGYYHPTMRTVTGEIVPSSDALLSDYLSEAFWIRRATNAVSIFERSDPIVDDRHSSEAQTIAEIRELSNRGAILRAHFQSPKTGALFPWAVLAATRGETLVTIPLGPVGLGSHDSALAEEWWIRWPPEMTSGTYELTCLFYDPLRSQSATGPPHLPRGRDSWLDRVKLGQVTLPPMAAPAY